MSEGSVVERVTTGGYESVGDAQADSEPGGTWQEMVYDLREALKASNDEQVQTAREMSLLEQRIAELVTLNRTLSDEGTEARLKNAELREQLRRSENDRRGLRTLADTLEDVKNKLCDEKREMQKQLDILNEGRTPSAPTGDIELEKIVDESRLLRRVTQKLICEQEYVERLELLLDDIVGSIGERRRTRVLVEYTE